MGVAYLVFRGFNSVTRFIMACTPCPPLILSTCLLEWLQLSSTDSSRHHPQAMARSHQPFRHAPFPTSLPSPAQPLVFSINARWGTPNFHTSFHPASLASTICVFIQLQLDCTSLTNIMLFRYLHLGFRAPEHLMERSRVSLVWAILRVRHPLLAARVDMHDYDDVRFV